MTLMKNVRNQDLAYWFGISQMAVSRMLKKGFIAMDSRMVYTLIKWPDCDVLKHTMPFCFHFLYVLRVSAIIDYY